MRFYWITLLGLAGIYSRYGIDVLFARRLGSSGQTFPWATFTINITGSFFAGLFFVLCAERSWISPELRTGLIVGFLGGFTTFSAFSLQTTKLWESGAVTAAALYFSLSPILGVGGAFLGSWAARKLIS